MIELIFPPAASPTSVPLGVSFLKSHIDSTCGPGHIRIQDLNIRYWMFLTGQSQEFSEYQGFLKGENGPFSRALYEPQLPIQILLKEESNRQLDAIRRWLDSRILSEDLIPLFQYLKETISTDDEPVMFSCLFPDQFLFTLGFSLWLSQIRKSPIYLGGASVLVVDPKELLELAPWITGVFTGEGELALEKFIKGGAETPIPGLYRRRNGEILRELPPEPPEMNKLVIPDFSWASLASYFNPEPVLPVQFSRGCKWRRCRFCAHNFSFGQYRCLDPVAVVDMLAHYGETLGARHFYITDQYLDASFLEPFAREVLSRNLYIRYTFMGRPAEDMTEDVLALLSQSGCRWISWGVESGNARVLEIAGKGTSPPEVARVLKDSAKAGIRNQALMIFGLPGSNDVAAEETFSFLQENQPWIHSHTASEFQLYSGTPFGNKPERFDLKVTGRDVFCRISGHLLKSVKLHYTNKSTDTEPELLRGPVEARKWKRRKIWIYPDEFWNTLPSEHYLILSAREIDLELPDNPATGNKAV